MGGVREMTRPFLIIVLNLLASSLAAQGILDVESKDEFINLADTIIAALMTLGVAVYSISKTIDLHKHSLKIKSTEQTVTTTSLDGDKTVEITKSVQQTPVSTVPIELNPSPVTGLQETNTEVVQ